MPDYSTRIVISADDQASGSIRQVGQTLSSLAGSADHAGGFIDGLADDIKNVESKLSDLGSQVASWADKHKGAIAATAAAAAGVWAAMHPEDAKRLWSEATDAVSRTADTIKTTLTDAYEQAASSSGTWAEKAQSGLDAVKEKAFQIKSDLGNLGTIGSQLVNTAAAEGFSLLGDAALKLGKNAVQAGADLDQLSHYTGITVEQLSRLQSVADQTQISFDALTGVYQKLQDAETGQSEAAQLARDSLKDMGISLKDSQGNFKSQDDLLLELSERMRSYSDSGADAANKIALLSNVIGPANKEMMDLVNEGPEAISVRLQEAARLHTIYTDQMAADMARIQKVQAAESAEDDAWSKRESLIWASLGASFKDIATGIIFDHDSLGDAASKGWSKIKSAASDYFQYLLDRHSWITQIANKALESMPTLMGWVPESISSAIRQSAQADHTNPVVAALGGHGGLYSAHGGGGSPSGGPGDGSNPSGQAQGNKNPGAHPQPFSVKAPKARDIADYMQEDEPDHSDQIARANAEMQKFIDGIKNSALSEQGTLLGDTFGAERQKALKTYEDELGNLKEKLASTYLEDKQGAEAAATYWAKYRLGIALSKVELDKFNDSMSFWGSTLSRLGSLENDPAEQLAGQLITLNQQLDQTEKKLEALGDYNKSVRNKAYEDAGNWAASQSGAADQAAVHQQYLDLIAQADERYANDEAQRTDRLDALKKQRMLEEQSLLQQSLGDGAALTNTYWQLQSQALDNHLAHVKKNADDEVAYEIYASQKRNELAKKELDYKIQYSDNFADYAKRRAEEDLGLYKDELGQRQQMWSDTYDAMKDKAGDFGQDMERGISDFTEDVFHGSCKRSSHYWDSMLDNMLTTLAETITQMFWIIAARPLVMPIVAEFIGIGGSGGLMSFVGNAMGASGSLAGASSSSSNWSMVSNVSTLGSGAYTLGTGNSLLGDIGSALGLTGGAAGTTAATTGSSVIDAAASGGNVADAAMNGWSVTTAGTGVGSGSLLATLGPYALAGSLGYLGGSMVFPNNPYAGATGAVGALGGMALGAEAGSWGGPIGAAVGAALGAVIGTLFGGGEKKEIKEQGVDLTGSGEGLSGDAYTIVETTKYGFLGSKHTSDETFYGQVDPSTMKALNDQYMVQVDAITSLTDQLHLGDDALDGFTTGMKRFANNKDFSTNFTNWLAEEKEAMASFVLAGHESLEKTGETAVDTLTRLASSLSSVQSAADSAVINLEKLSGNLHGLDLAGYAQQLIDALGSVQNVQNMFGLADTHYLTGASGSAAGIQYWRPQAEDALAALNIPGLTLGNFWSAYGYSMSQPMTADMANLWYKAAEVIDKLGTYEQSFLSATGTSYYSLANPGQAMDQVGQSSDELVASYQSQVTTAQNLVNTLQSSLLSLEQQRLSLLQDQAKTLQSTHDTFAKWVSDLTNFRSSLASGDLSPLSPGDQLVTAGSRFDELVSKTKKGDTDAYGQLQSASQDYLKLAQQYSATSGDYESVWYHVKAGLQDVQDYAGDQVDVAQQQLDALNKQIDSLGSLVNNTASMDQVLASIDSTQQQLTAAQSSLVLATQNLSAAQAQQSADIMSMINTGSKSITDALRMSLLMNTDEGKLVYSVSTELLGSAPSDDWLSGWYANVMQLEKMYGQYFSIGGGAVQDSAGTLPAILAELMTHTGEYNAAQAAGTAMGVDASSMDALFRLLDALPTLGDTQRPNALSAIFPGFASGTDYFPGGYRIVGENGPELEATGPSRIFDALTTRQIFAGVSSGTSLEDIRELQRQIAALQQAQNDASYDMTEALRKMNRILTKWDKTGMPQA